MTQQAEPVQNKPQPPKPLIAVRFGYLGWVGEFRHDPALKLKWSDLAVVKTERGIEIGTPVAAACPEVCPKCVRPESLNAYVKASGDEHLERNAGEVVRVATPEDLAEQRRIDSYADEKLEFCGRAASKVGLDMRMIACEHLLGGERIIFYFSAEGRIDFRQLVRDLAREFHTRIEMRQIGARDEARIVADLEICGRECCCKNFLKVLRPVNMKMAKLQKATLDPTKVSGRCGRLRCCLRYEQLTYEELDAKLPDLGTRVRVEQGIGFIRDRQVITQIVVLDMGEGRRLAVPLEEIKEILPAGAPGEFQERRPTRRRPSDADENGDVPPTRSGEDKADAGPVIAPEGKPATANQPDRPPLRRGREPDRQGGRDGARDSGRDGTRDGGNGRPPRRPQPRSGGRGEERSQGPGREQGAGAEPRSESPRAESRGESRPDARPERRVPPRTDASQPARDAASPPADSAPAPAGQSSDSPPPNSPTSAGEGGQGRRRRRRRGRRGRAEGSPRSDEQPPRADNNPPPLQ